jgi:putative Holliday junction resolvase
VSRATASRVLGVDFGSKRIGLAASDTSNTLASPLDVLSRAEDPDDDLLAILGAAHSIGAKKIVVGLPVRLDGSQGPEAREVLDEVRALRRFARPERITVDTYDERFSTVIAEQNMLEAKVRKGRRRRLVDAAAATVILQGWLEAHA